MVEANKTVETKYLFEIPIGDWSDDGHGKCVYYKYESNKPIEDIREAYFKAKDLLGRAYPEEICSDYDEFKLDEETYEELVKAGFKLNEKDECDYINQTDMLDIVVWFLKVGDPELKIKRISEEKVPMLTFYGVDPKGRHIGGFGYGLFD